jgi:hypothetical protein
MWSSAGLRTPFGDGRVPFMYNTSRPAIRPGGFVICGYEPRLVGQSCQLFGKVGNFVRRAQRVGANHEPSHDARRDRRVLGAHVVARAEAGALHRRRVELGRQGLGRDAAAHRPGLSRYLRPGDEQPGAGHPLRPDQPAAGDAGRAGLRALDRHGGRAARGRRAAVQPGDPPRPGRLRHRRLQPALRTALHQRAQHAGPGRSAPARRRPHRRTPADPRRRQRLLQPRAHVRLLRRHGHRRGGGGDF